jgi:hypothetical protein
VHALQFTDESSSGGILERAFTLGEVSAEASQR